MIITITDCQKKELNTLKHCGSYRINRQLSIYENYIALIVLKYLIYSNIKTWRRWDTRFKDINITDGQWKRGVRILNDMGLLIRLANRWVCKDKTTLKKGVDELEKKIKEGEKK